MNKKLLLLAALGLLSLGNLNAQTTVFSENFDGATAPTGWTILDADGDGQNWTITDNTTHSRPGVASGKKMLLSLSYLNGPNGSAGAPLTPDNYILSPAIDLSAHAGKTIKLKWKVASQDPSWSAETYSVYASTTNTVAGMLASSTVLSSASASGIIDLTTKELDISALAGQSVVYVAFRHHNSTDQFAIVIDDIEVVVTNAASSEDFFKENFTIYPNPTTDVLNITSKNGLNANEIRISDLTGKVVKVQKDASIINVSDLATGTYLIDITTNEGKATSKFIKK